MRLPNALRACCFALVFALSVAPSAHASELERLFARVARVELVSRNPSALVRLSLPPEVLSACRADLSDLRLLDARGVEVPFVLDRGTVPRVAPTKLKTLPAPPVGVERQKTPRPGAEPLLRESYELASPPPPPSGGSWQLVFEVEAAHFVRRLDVEGVLADGKRIELITNDSVFRLKGEHGERLRVPLPPLPSPRFRVVLQGEDTSSLDPRFRFEAVEQLPAEPEALVELALVRQSTPVGHSLVELLRPAGIVPSALRLATTTAGFNRAVEVRDVGGSQHGTTLGRASVFRIRGASLFEVLEIPLEPARGTELAVSIEDGDSPGLEALTFSAVVHMPSLVFSLPAGSESVPALTLYFGGGRTHAPRYDLSALAPADRSATPSNDVRARAGASLFDPAQLSSARVTHLEDNPKFDRTPALAFAQRPGAALDPGVFSHRRRVALRPSPDGLAELVLAAEDLALLRGDLGDARVVDEANRQWPFLLESARHEELVPLTLGKQRRDAALSHVTLELPFSPLYAKALVIETPETYFARSFQLDAVLTDGQRRQVASGRFARAAGEPSLPLVLEFGPERVRSLELGIEDGDNAPLRFTSVIARAPVPALYVVARPGNYHLLLGNASTAPAQYDLESARNLVLSVTSQKGAPGPLEANPAYRAASRFVAGGGPERVALWVVLGLAVLLLGGMTLRLLRNEPKPE